MSEAIVVGIDLGTTHTAVAIATPESNAATRCWPITQLVTASSVEPRPLLASTLYFSHQSEPPLSLPWDAERRFAVGEFARSRSADAPGRVVASAKSWLSHTGVDRRSALLPQGAPADVEKISPVEAAWRLLDHLSEAWQAEDASRAPLGDQDVVLTVPASFDAAARDLTVEAAYAAGFENVTLLEEPQAALYAWISAQGEGWRQHLKVGDVVLVIDVGGGTTDFSAISVVGREGNLALERVAVGDHILLGGDNMDLTLAHAVRAKLPEQGKNLDRWQMASLSHACRVAKEHLLGTSTTATAPIAVAARGSNLVGSALRTELAREEVEQIVFEGFFPKVGADARPATRARSALTQLGLPYASDPGITRHLAAFLARQAGATTDGGGSLLKPTAVLFNGGVLKSETLRSRLLDTLNSWLAEAGASPARALPGADPDLAVARGAAYYGLVRRGCGLRIRGGTAHAYYVGIESPMPAIPGVEPPIVALCVAPFGMEEGSDAQPVGCELGLVVGEPVRFRFFASTVRRTDAFGIELDHWEDGELVELAPIELTLPSQGRTAGEVVTVSLVSQVTAIGTLKLLAVPSQAVKEGERWEIELSVRS